jgi:Uma2 family endonuclease
MSTKTLITADELEQMPGDDSVQIELDEGELITMPPAGGEHGDSGGNIAFS